MPSWLYFSDMCCIEQNFFSCVTLLSELESFQESIYKSLEELNWQLHLDYQTWDNNTPIRREMSPQEVPRLYTKAHNLQTNILMCFREKYFNGKADSAFHVQYQTFYMNFERRQIITLPECFTQFHTPVYAILKLTWICKER